MNFTFDVDKIVTYLEPLRDKLPELYNWNAKIDRLADLSVLNESEIEDLNKLVPFEREIILKERVRVKLHEFKEADTDKFNQLCLWIIKDWGGILTAKDDDTIELVSSFLQAEKPSYKRIASASKVGSYMYPEKYIIYDSRVAYSLNWIILSEKAGDFYFPIPNGRNSKMMAFDMNVLIRMKNIEKYRPETVGAMDNRLYITQKDKSLYIPEKESYTELNKLITEVNNKLWSGEKANKLYYTEMLLFSIADREVFKDITEKASFELV